MAQPLSFLEASRLTEGRANTSSFCSSPPSSTKTGRQDRLHLDANVSNMSLSGLEVQPLTPDDGRDRTRLGGALAGAALAASTMMESARAVADGGLSREAPRHASAGSRQAVIAGDAAGRPRAVERIGRVVGRFCDGAQHERLRACFAGWMLLASRKVSELAGGVSADELSRQLEAMQQASAETARRLQLSEARARELTEQLSQQRKSSALLSDMAARRVSALEAELAKLKEAGAAAVIDPGGTPNGCGSAARSSPRSCDHQAFKAQAAALLERRDRASLLHDCFMRWHSSSAEGHAMQVKVMRERLERADAECCALRGQEEELRTEAQRWRSEAQNARARTDWAEAELLRRSGHEFARLRELQGELAKLQAEASPMLAAHLQAGRCSCSNGPAEASPCTKPTELSRSPTGGARISAARGMANTHAAALTRAWLKLCLSAWCAQASARGLAFALVVQCAAAEDTARCGRALVAWRLAVDRSRLLGAAYQLAEAACTRQATPLVRLVLRRWHTVASEPPDATVGNSLDACSPLSGQTFCSAVMWSPTEKSMLTDAVCSTAASASALAGGTTGGSSLEEGGTGAAGGQRATRPTAWPFAGVTNAAPEREQRAPAGAEAPSAGGLGGAASQRPWVPWSSWGLSRKSGGSSRPFASDAP